MAAEPTKQSAEELAKKLADTLGGEVTPSILKNGVYFTSMPPSSENSHVEVGSNYTRFMVRSDVLALAIANLIRLHANPKEREAEERLRELGKKALAHLDQNGSPDCMECISISFKAKAARLDLEAAKSGEKGRGESEDNRT